MFTIYDVDNYPAVSIGEIPQTLNHGYGYLLYDFGVLTETNYQVISLNSFTIPAVIAMIISSIIFSIFFFT